MRVMSDGKITPVGILKVGSWTGFAMLNHSYSLLEIPAMTCLMSNEPFAHAVCRSCGLIFVVCLYDHEISAKDLEKLRELNINLSGI